MSRSIVASAAVAVAATVSFAAPAVAKDEVVKVAHPAVTASLAPVTPGQASAGDIRTYWTPLTKPGKTKSIGFMTGYLLTTALNKPETGKELRTADLVFTIGAAENQLEIGGVAAYDGQAPTVAQKTSVIRPVVGGSGRYAGAHGWAKSIHLKDGTWRHIFHIHLP